MNNATQKFIRQSFNMGLTAMECWNDCQVFGHRATYRSFAWTLSYA